MLSGVALFFIVFLIVVFAAIIVFLGSLPGKIAHQRGHPYPEAVNVASWIGLATGVFWPVALIWAFLPFPNPANGGSAPASEPAADLADLQKRLAALEKAMKELQSQPVEDAT